MTGLAVALALLGAACNVVAARNQHRAVQVTVDAAGGSQLGIAGLRRLLGARVWLTGLLALGCGAGLHAVALAFAPLAVVQPLGALSLVAITVLQARAERRAATAAVAGAVAASALGIAVFVLLAARGGTVARAPASSAGGVLLAGGAIAAAGIAAGAVLPRWRCAALGFAGAACYGMVSVLAHVSAVLLRLAGVAALPGLLLPVAGVTGAAVAGGVAVQHAYAAGPPDVVMACTTVVDPMVAIGIGALLLGESQPATPAAAVAQLSAAALGVGGVLWLARARHRQHVPPVSIHQQCPPKSQQTSVNRSESR